MGAPIYPKREGGPRGILYDLDGVLVDSAPAWFRVVGRAAEHFGAPPIDEASFRRAFGQGIEADRRIFFPRQSAEEIGAFYDQVFEEEVAAVRVMEGARELLEGARGRGLRQAVVTNAPRGSAQAMMEATGLGDRVDLLVAAGDAAEKPAPDLILLALDRLGLRPEEAVYLGDSTTDVAAARAAGIFMFGIGIDADLRVERTGELIDRLGDGALTREPPSRGA